VYAEGRAPDPGAIEQLLSDAEEFFEVMATGHFARGIDRRLAAEPFAPREVQESSDTRGAADNAG